MIIMEVIRFVADDTGDWLAERAEAEPARDARLHLLDARLAPRPEYTAFSSVRAVARRDPGSSRLPSVGA